MYVQVPSHPRTSTPTSVDRAHPSTIERKGIKVFNRGGLGGDGDSLIIMVKGGIYEDISRL